MGREPAPDPGPERGLAEEAAPARPAGFFDLVNAHRPELERRALWLTRNPSDAADLVQDTILRAYGDTRAEVTAEMVPRWLFRIMYHAFVDDCRTRAARRFVPLGVRVERQLVCELSLSRPALWRMVDDQTLYACVARLPGSMKDMVRWHLEGVRYDEMGRRLGLLRSTVGTRLMRAKRRLRKLLGASVPDDEGAPPRRRP